MIWFDVFVFVSVILCLVFHCIREEFERSITRRQLLVEQNLSPNSNIDDEIAPVRFIWRILDKYNIILIHVPSNYSPPPSSADNNNNSNNNIV